MDWPSILRATDIVIVPPMEGWKASLDVWHASRAALEISKPVYTLQREVRHG
jgi:hypothetical protein